MICDRKKKTHCQAMELAVDSGVVDRPIVLNYATGEEVPFRHGIYVKAPRKARKGLHKTLLYLNLCPWCKGDLGEKP